MTTSRSAFITASAAAVAAGALPLRSQAADPIALRVATLPFDMGGQGFYAQELGYVKDANLAVDLSWNLTGSAVGAAVASGSIDIGHNSVVSLAVAHDHGLPFVIIAPSASYRRSEPTSVLFTLNSSPIRVAKDLTGKTIAVAGLASITQLSVQAWLDQNGGDAAAVKFLEISFAAMPAALLARRVDAAQIPDPGASEARRNPNFRTLAHCLDVFGDNYLIGGWFSTVDWARKNGEAIRRFNAVMERAAKWANEHHRESAQLLEKAIKVKVGDAYRVPFLGRLEPALVQPEIDVAARYKVIKASFPGSEIIYRPNA